jgi:hypothetical protein
MVLNLWGTAPWTEDASALGPGRVVHFREILSEPEQPARY